MFIKKNKFIQTLTLLIILLFIQGCAVLTQSQVDAVKSFAIAADNYSDLPGSVINLHADSKLEESYFLSSNLIVPEEVVEKINKKATNHLALQKHAETVNSALSVIDAYVKLLQKLTSDDFTNQLKEESIALGAAIDGGIARYNAVAGTDKKVDSFGSTAAGIVRGIGGIIIRKKQTEALQKAVTDAEPVMQTMTEAVIGLMDSYIGPLKDDKGNVIKDDKGNVIDGLADGAVKELKTAYEESLKSGKTNNSVKNVKNITQLLIKANSIKSLAERNKKAIKTFQVAHTKLRANLQKNEDLKEGIEEISVLYGEIRAAQKLKNDLDKDK